MDPTTKPDTFDPARLLTLSALAFVGILIVFVAAIIGIQIVQRGTANTESWAALTGLIGWVTGVVGTLFSNRFGTTQQSADKDLTIRQQARTVAVAQDALLDPTVIVSVDQQKRVVQSAVVPVVELTKEVT